MNLTWQVGIVEFVGVVQAFARNELHVFAAKDMAFARCEVPEGHFEGAADLRFQMMHSAGKAVGRKPFRERVCLEERAIDLLWAGRQNAVQTYGVGHAGLSL